MGWGLGPGREGGDHRCLDMGRYYVKGPSQSPSRTFLGHPTVLSSRPPQRHTWCRGVSPVVSVFIGPGYVEVEGGREWRMYGPRLQSDTRQNKVRSLLGKL